jgi:hypothetical protein
LHFLIEDHVPHFSARRPDHLQQPAREESVGLKSGLSVLETVIQQGEHRPCEEVRRIREVTFAKARSTSCTPSPLTPGIVSTFLPLAFAFAACSRDCAGLEDKKKGASSEAPSPCR